MLRDVLSKIGNEYPHARTQPFSKHPLAQFIRSEATQELRVALGELGNGLICEGGAGAGQFATVPWLAIFDPVRGERGLPRLSRLSATPASTVCPSAPPHQLMSRGPSLGLS